MSRERTLAEWSQDSQVVITTYNKCKLVVDGCVDKPGLYNLKDYLVSSLSGGMLWLVPRKAQKLYEIREGNGNDGCRRRGTVESESAGQALILAYRMGMINPPPDVRPTVDVEGDSIQAYLVSHVGCNDLGCRWCAEANDIVAIEQRLQEFSQSK